MTTHVISPRQTGGDAGQKLPQAPADTDSSSSSASSADFTRPSASTLRFERFYYISHNQRQKVTAWIDLEFVVSDTHASSHSTLGHPEDALTPLRWYCALTQPISSIASRFLGYSADLFFNRRPLVPVMISPTRCSRLMGGTFR